MYRIKREKERERERKKEREREWMQEEIDRLGPVDRHT